MIVFEVLLCIACLIGGYEYGYEKAQADIEKQDHKLEQRIKQIENAN